MEGRYFDPPKPLSQVTLPVLTDSKPPTFEGPKLPPLKLDGLLATRPADPANSGPLPPAAPQMAPELYAEFVDYVRKFEAGLAKKAGIVARIDYAIAQVHLGRYVAAIQELLAVEEAFPGMYETAANLGTVYELAGELDDAVVWIARGLERSASSHHGTEWLRVAILRTKLKLRDDPAWLKDHNVLDEVTDRTAEEILRAIEYQLAERLQFVKPVDPVVCDLFYQAALRVSGENAEARRAYYLRESLRYGDWRKREIAALSKT